MNGWLVLNRRPGERILIGDDIEIAVSKIDAGQVAIAIRAPREVRVRRSELAAETREPPAPDLGICPHCEGADVNRPDPLADSFRCSGCRSTWYGVRRLAA